MNLIRKLAVVFVALGGVSVAQADLITYDYSGTITYAGNSAGSLNFLGLETGDTVTGSFTYDSTAQDTDLDPVSIVLPNSLTAFRFDGLVAGIIDYSYFQAPTGISGPIQSYVYDLNNGYSDYYTFSEIDSRFEFNRNFRSSAGSYENTVYYASLNSLSITSVPEPTTLALFGIGLAAMGLARRKKAKTR